MMIAEVMCMNNSAKQSWVIFAVLETNYFIALEQLAKGNELSKCFNDMLTRSGWNVNSCRKYSTEAGRNNKTVPTISALPRT